MPAFNIAKARPAGKDLLDFVNRDVMLALELLDDRIEPDDAFDPHSAGLGFGALVRRRRPVTFEPLTFVAVAARARASRWAAIRFRSFEEECLTLMTIRSKQ
jgi:hypothetical protein